MKRLVFAAALSFVASAFADTVQSANTFGVLKIADTTHANVAVCVPWVAAGTGGSVNVTNLVMASNRETGDVVYYYDATAKNFKAWELQNGAWTAISSVGTAGSIGVAVPDDAVTAARGGALIIHRGGETSVAKPPIYLYGQYSGDAATTTVAAATEEVPVVISLIAPPSTTNYVMTSKTPTSGSIGANDYIQLSGDKKRYQYNSTSSKWGYYSTSEAFENGEWKVVTTFNEGLTIPAGQGALYVSKGGNPTFTW